jgi:endoglucanase
LPGNYTFHENYLDEIETLVESCKQRNMYCILDWHAIGNPLHNQTRLKEYFHERNGTKIFWYDAYFELAKIGIQALAKRFGHNKHVIFELYNEPCPGEKDVSQLDLKALPWNDWKKLAGELLTIVRKETQQLVLVSSNYWTYNLQSTAKDQITSFENIAYSFHCYPLKNNQNWKEMLESLHDVPIVVTEFGYDRDETSMYKGTFEEYFKPFMEYLREHEISWTAWCFSISWRPRILKQWNPLTLSEYGKNLIHYLSDKVQEDQKTH